MRKVLFGRGARVPFWLVPLGLGLLFIAPAQAGLFEDDDARKAILELRQKLDLQKEFFERRLQEEQRRGADDVAPLRRSLLELQGQIDAIRGEMATLRGQNEGLQRDLSELQRRHRDLATGLDERVRKFEPVKVQVDGREFLAEPAEKRDYDAALALFRQGEFERAQVNFSEFLRRYPQSGYGPATLFWLGNAQYALKDYKAAVSQFRMLLSVVPDHPKASETMLSLANSQIELKDTKAARKTLEDLVRAHPQTEAAAVAKDRLQKLK